jgi:transcription elongation factor GreA
MAEETAFLTAEGHKKLQTELEHLKTVRRREVAENIRDAKEGGDISENAGYEQAKEEQAFVEGRIMTLEGILRAAAIIEETGPTDQVRLGSRVTVVEIAGERRGPPETYHIVGSAEADPSSGRISNESPLGKALIGLSASESVTVSAPAGDIRFEIVSIQ